MTCPACEQATIDGAAYCAWCGSRRVPCPHDPTGGRFCIRCGPPVTPLAAADGAPGSYTPKHLADRILTSRTALEGERKQVTVTFADVENFTRLGERLGPEDLRQTPV